MRYEKGSSDNEVHTYIISNLPCVFHGWSPLEAIPPSLQPHQRTRAQRLAEAAGAGDSMHWGGACFVHGQREQTPANPLLQSLSASLHRCSTWVPNIHIISEKEKVDQVWMRTILK